MVSDHELRRALERRRRDIERGLDEQLEQFRAQRVEAGRDAPGDGIEVEVWEETEVALIEMRLETLEKIEAALMRLELGDYGCCVDCGERISDARLHALPLSPRCSSCDEAREEGERQRRAFDRLLTLMTNERLM